ncbi:nucleobindin 1 [Trichuris trichiura]|uniref:Nucleobindin 1 n=1 Tax=Trichuris trichiura TaxID=36087 RepID=A0A077ZAK1_TRITR|nr:nucleobindin 1 [Trichuris trichiura]
MSPGKGGLNEYNLEYERYLKEVVTALESDSAFAERLRNATPEEIQSGRIAEALDFVGHGVRTKLNQIKLVEIERLRRALEEARDHKNDPSYLEHLDHAKEAFDKRDLEKLIRKTAKDLEIMDQQRQQEYKRHEMDEELEFRHSLKNMTAEQKKAAEEARNEELKKLKEMKLKHPGSKGQLEKVWEEVDNLPKEAFDMKTFFRLHDTNNDGYLDALELEALFQNELDRVYDRKTHFQEREEELTRMRRHVVEEMDKDGDHLISLSEFLGEEKTADFQSDSDWSVMNPEEAFSENELRSYEAVWEKEHGYATTISPTMDPNQLNAQYAQAGNIPHGQPVPHQYPQHPGVPTPNVAPGGQQYGGVPEHHMPGGGQFQQQQQFGGQPQPVPHPVPQAGGQYKGSPNIPSQPPYHDATYQQYQQAAVPQHQMPVQPGQPQQAQYQQPPQQVVNPHGQPQMAPQPQAMAVPGQQQAGQFQQYQGAVPTQNVPNSVHYQANQQQAPNVAQQGAAHMGNVPPVQNPQVPVQNQQQQVPVQIQPPAGVPAM